MFISPSFQAQCKKGCIDTKRQFFFCIDKRVNRTLIEILLKKKATAGFFSAHSAARRRRRDNAYIVVKWYQ